MKKYVFPLLLAVAASVSAQPLPPPPPPPPPTISLGAQFDDGIKIQEFAKVVLRDVLKAQYVFSSAFLSDTSVVGFSANQLKKAGSIELLKDVLAQHNYSIEYRSNYYRIYPTPASAAPAATDDRVDFVYRLKHRNLAYVSSYIEPLFKGFSHSRELPVDNRARVDSDAIDTGKSLYSMSSNTSSDLILFRGLPSEVERLKDILVKLDVPVPRVLVRAVILESRNIERSGYSVSAVADLLASRLSVSIGSPATSGNMLSFTGSKFESVLSALQSDSNVKVLTAPSVFAQSGSSASLSVGASVPTLGAIQYDTNGRTQQSVAYQDTGVILRVTPRVLESSIDLKLEQEISDAVQTLTGVSGSPTITRSNLSTTFNLTPGQSVILGGLTSEKSSAARDALPFYRKLTLGDNSENSKSDIIIILTAELA